MKDSIITPEEATQKMKSIGAVAHCKTSAKSGSDPFDEFHNNRRGCSTSV